MTTDALTIHESAETTGWSPRMLRYIERSGLVVPARSASGYRLYGAAELQRLRTLRELLQRFELGLSDVVFALRLGQDAELRGAVEEWLEAEPAKPEHVAASDWLDWEQDKHQKLLAAARSAPADLAIQSAPADWAATTPPTTATELNGGSTG